MAKLQKHAQILDQLHSMVKKQAEEAQKSISGAPGEDVKSVSVGDEHERYSKNSVGPENVPQGYHQKPSDDSAEPLAKAKTANDLGMEILDIIRKQADAQDSVTGAIGDVKSESVGDDKEKTNKNAVKPENNKQNYDQKGSSDSSEPLTGAKKAEVEELAAKVASYELGRQFCAALLKAAGDDYSSNQDVELMKAAGRRDFDLMIAEAAADLEGVSDQEKQAAEEAGAEDFDSFLTSSEAEKQAAEQAGATYFDDLLKQAALQEALEENQALTAKVAEYESFFSNLQQQQEADEAQEKLASTVADTVLSKLKSEAAEASSH
jgi:hypothetical protein